MKRVQLLPVMKGDYSMAPKNYTEYTEDQRKEFLEYAKDVGIAKAIRDLGYPTFPTAKKWAKQYGVELPLNQLSQISNSMKDFYKMEEKVYTAQLIIDRVQENLVENAGLNGDELKKHAEALKKAVETIQLVEGKATQITENISSDPFDNAYVSLIDEMERQNALKELEVRDRNKEF